MPLGPILPERELNKRKSASQYWLTIIRPSPAAEAAFLARPWETPNSSNTATKDSSREIMDSGEMRPATVRWAKNCIYGRVSCVNSEAEEGLHIGVFLAMPLYPNIPGSPSKNLPKWVGPVRVHRTLLDQVHYKDYAEEQYRTGFCMAAQLH